MRITVVHLLRHGKVQNPGNILYGRLPGYRLAASGQAMATGVADYLAGSDITHLVASSLQRAQETAAPLSSTFGLPIVTDDRIIEAANDFEGLEFGLNGQTLGRPRTWVKLRDPLKPSWGEPYLDIAHRMVAAIYAAVQAAVCDDIAAFTTSLGWTVAGVIPSPITGGDGNTEFLLGAHRAA